MSEPSITINGNQLNDAQAMTFRVAIEHFSSALTEGGLGDDFHGKRMTEAYQQRIEEMRGFIFND